MKKTWKKGMMVLLFEGNIPFNVELIVILFRLLLIQYSVLFLPQTWSRPPQSSPQIPHAIPRSALKNKWGFLLTLIIYCLLYSHHIFFTAPHFDERPSSLFFECMQSTMETSIAGWKDHKVQRYVILGQYLSTRMFRDEKMEMVNTCQNTTEQTLSS